MSTAVALVRAGLGVTILPSTAAETQSEGVVTRPVEDIAFIRRLVLVRRKAAGLRTIARQFIDNIIAQFPANAEAAQSGATGRVRRDAKSRRNLSNC
jgi:DNA-binding transcriptional LysR family regulator